MPAGEAGLVWISRSALHKVCFLSNLYFCPELRLVHFFPLGRFEAKTPMFTVLQVRLRLSDSELTAVRFIRPVSAVIVSVTVVDVQDTAAICALELLHAAGGCHHI